MSIYGESKITKFYWDKEDSNLMALFIKFPKVVSFEDSVREAEELIRQKIRQVMREWGINVTQPLSCFVDLIALVRLLDNTRKFAMRSRSLKITDKFFENTEYLQKIRKLTRIPADKYVSPAMLLYTYVTGKPLDRFYRDNLFDLTEEEYQENSKYSLLAVFPAYMVELSPIIGLPYWLSRDKLYRVSVNAIQFILNGLQIEDLTERLRHYRDNNIYYYPYESDEQLLDILLYYLDYGAIFVRSPDVPNLEQYVKKLYQQVLHHYNKISDVKFLLHDTFRLLTDREIEEGLYKPIYLLSFGCRVNAVVNRSLRDNYFNDMVRLMFISKATMGNEVVMTPAILNTIYQKMIGENIKNSYPIIDQVIKLSSDSHDRFKIGGTKDIDFDFILGIYEYLHNLSERTAESQKIYEKLTTYLGEPEELD